MSVNGRDVALPNKWLRRSRNQRRRSRRRQSRVRSRNVALDGDSPLSSLTSLSPTADTAECTEIALPQNTSVASVEAPVLSLSQPEKFACQLAQGSPTAFVSGFNNPAELYEKVADCFGINAEDVLFCTKNTHHVEMSAQVTANIDFGAFIFAHLKGQRKEVQIHKTETLLGLTVVENGAGKSIIKCIGQNSLSSRADPALQIGDFIESINGEAMSGKRHFEVTRILRNIPVGETFTLRLVSPFRSGFSFISKPRVVPNVPKVGANDGTQTIRFRATGEAVIQEAPDRVIIDRMNAVFDTYLGLHDDDLAQTVWEIGRQCADLVQMGAQIRASPVGSFEFPDELVYDMWGVVDDWKNNRLVSNRETEDKEEERFADH